DPASNLERYADASGQETLYTYDALNRRRSTTWPDTTTITVTHEPTGQISGWSDPNGTRVTQEHDPAGRLTSRTITRGIGVEGPGAESYGWDGLNRLVSATSGGVVSTRAYDSMSRLVAETTAGRTIAYTPDDVGNLEGIAYPSGRSIESAFDKI